VADGARATRVVAPWVVSNPLSEFLRTSTPFARNKLGHLRVGGRSIFGENLSRGMHPLDHCIEVGVPIAILSVEEVKVDVRGWPWDRRESKPARLVVYALRTGHVQAFGWWDPAVA
jgi:hypothetical protein